MPNDGFEVLVANIKKALSELEHKDPEWAISNATHTLSAAVEWAEIHSAAAMQQPPLVLGCAHGRLPGTPCSHCMGIGSKVSR